MSGVQWEWGDREKASQLDEKTQSMTLKLFFLLLRHDINTEKYLIFSVRLDKISHVCMLRTNPQDCSE